MEQLEEIAQGSCGKSNLPKTCIECKYIGNGLFAVGTGIAISGGVTGAYSQLLAGGFAAGGAASRLVVGYTERCYNRRRDDSAQTN